MPNIKGLFGKEIKVINMGLEAFAQDLKEQNVKVLHVNWKPVAGGNKKMADLLMRLKN